MYIPNYTVRPTIITEKYFWAPGIEFLGRKYAFFPAGRY